MLYEVITTADRRSADCRCRQGAESAGGARSAGDGRFRRGDHAGGRRPCAAPDPAYP